MSELSLQDIVEPVAKEVIENISRDMYATVYQTVMEEFNVTMDEFYRNVRSTYTLQTSGEEYEAYKYHQKRYDEIFNIISKDMLNVDEQFVDGPNGISDGTVTFNITLNETEWKFKNEKLISEDTMQVFNDVMSNVQKKLDSRLAAI